MTQPPSEPVKVNLISELLTKLDQWIDGLDVYSPNSRVSETPDRENYED